MKKNFTELLMAEIYKISAIFLLLIAITNNVYAHEKRAAPSSISGYRKIALKFITGTVSDDKNQPLSGVSVKIKGTNTGTVTDEKGNFTLSVKEENKTILEISLVGYQAKTVEVTDQINLKITLAVLSKDLTEVVVVGYGKQKKTTLTGSVALVSAKDIQSSPAANLSNSLVGRAPGIIAVQRSGEPGNDQSDIFIRGIGTTGDASPLYVIDGIVSSPADFAQLNSSEIESLSILKDASSAAVFGVRGGNGIVLVTTKRGTLGKFTFNYTFNYGIQQRTRTPDFVNAAEYATLMNEAFINQGDTALYTADDIRKFSDGSDPNGHPNTNWYNAVLKKSAPMVQHNLSASGGTDKIRYALSFSSLDQNGIYNGSEFKRYNFRSNIDANVTSSTKLSFDISGRNEIRDAPPIKASDLFYSLLRNRAIDAVKYTNGDYAAPVQGNSLADIQSTEGYSQSTGWFSRMRLQLEQKLPLKGLSIQGIAAFDKSFVDSATWNSPTIQTYNYNPSSGDFVVSGPVPLASLSQSESETKALTLEAHLNYANSFGKNNVTGLLLYTQTDDSYSSFGAGRQQYVINVDQLNLGPVNNFLTNYGYSGGGGRIGYVGRATYSYDDKYLFETSFREDASEQFAPNKRWGFFPSFSGGWVISKENFMSNVNAVNFLKLRASYGILGNDRISNQTFLYLSSFNVGGNAIFGNDQAQQIINEGRLGNPNVTWETVKKLDIGMDATIKNGLLGLTVDYFKDKRDNILAQPSAAVPVIAGITLPVENIAKVNNGGVDFAISHANKIGQDFSYNLVINGTFVKNKVISIDEPAGTNPNIALTGRPLGSLFGYEAVGLFQNQQEIEHSPDQTALGAAPQPGDIKYADISGPNGKPDGKIDGYDLTYIGTSNIPQVIYGFSGGVKYKRIEINFLFQGATKVQQYLSQEAAWPFFNGGNALKENLDAWTPTNTGASQPRVLINDNPNRLYSSFWLKDASYFRLRNLEIAYSLAPSILQKVKISNLRIYVNANNVFTLSKIKNFDPENGDPRGQSYPQLRIFNLGASVQF